MLNESRQRRKDGRKLVKSEIKMAAADVVNCVVETEIREKNEM